MNGYVMMNREKNPIVDRLLRGVASRGPGSGEDVVVPDFEPDDPTVDEG